MKIETILEDTRPIASLIFSDDSMFCVGKDTGITEIKPYREAGQGGWMPYFAVYHGDHLFARVPAYQVTITYMKVEIQGETNAES